MLPFFLYGNIKSLKCYQLTNYTGGGYYSTSDESGTDHWPYIRPCEIWWMCEKNIDLQSNHSMDLKILYKRNFLNTAWTLFVITVWKMTQKFLNVLVHQDQLDRDEKLNGDKRIECLNSEANAVKDQTVYYDIRFKA